eukprot:gnl/TRDRNA2_/TRDRNA2_130051_c0_seq1.p1 gnl/TRDRNA2_/TRDRNA2_130051_c0~~gnl/TRDRNA2_/TRDRNA2_130051_c0_seq1.p1  ORF type:complete len:239 (-),score=56.97 gnl/TRDRNA2_/TRDRNA2_130051_c0_seq1:180-839(-)
MIPRDPPTLLELLKDGKSTEEHLLNVLAQDACCKGPLGEEIKLYTSTRPDKNGWTPMHWAAQDALDKVVDGLLKVGASPNAGDKLGATPLMIASFNGNLTTVELLTSHPDTDVMQVNIYKSTALHYAAMQGQSDVCEHLLNCKAEVDALDRHGETPLSWAARHGHMDTSKQLLLFGADPLQDNNAGEDCIEWARDAGHIELAESLEAAVDDPELTAMSK